MARAVCLPSGRVAERLRCLGRLLRWSSEPLPDGPTSVVVAGLFLGVTVLRWYFDRGGQVVALLYVLPVALSALWRGRRGGLVAAVAGAGLFVVFSALHERGDLDATGWAAPPAAMFLVGGLVGELAERASRARRLAARHAEQARRLGELCERQQVALETSDSLLQRVAAARWLLEAGSTEEAIDLLTAVVAEGIEELRNAGGSEEAAEALGPGAKGAGAAFEGPEETAGP